MKLTTRQLLTFFSLTYAVTWTRFAVAGTISRANASGARALAALTGALLLLGTFAPGLVALALTELTDGRAATRALLVRIFRWRVGVRLLWICAAYFIIRMRKMKLQAMESPVIAGGI
jgi:hypothetical protein